jgi:hypothetical protein
MVFRARRGSAPLPAPGTSSTPPSPPIERRQVWAAARFWMETENVKSKRYGGQRKHHGYALDAMTQAFAAVLKLAGQYERGVAHAMDLRVRELEHRFAQLPAAFDGYEILQLSDLHIDGMPGLDAAILDALAGRSFDLCILTGDYRHELHGPIGPALAGIETVVRGLRARDGVIAVLGNHDTCFMVDPLEAVGVRVLVNEQVELERGGDRVAVIGTDDVHYYFTDQAIHALEAAREAAFSIALVHSPELYDVAAEQGVDLYLCGHTHAGQICLPGGLPLITHLNRGRALFRGVWHHGTMRGYTHAGTGTSGIPVRFNTRGELVVHRLCRG